MSFSQAAGTITNIATLGFTLGALGLTLNFVDRAFDRVTPRNNGKSRSRGPVFDTGMSRNENLFSLPKPKKSRRGNSFNTELFSF